MRTDASPFSVVTPRNVALALALLASGCWYPKERGERLEQRVDRVEVEAPAGRQDGARDAAREQAQQRVEARLAELQKRLDAVAAAQQRRDAEAAKAQPGPDGARLERLGEELSRQRAALEAQARRLEGMEKTLARLESAPRERTVERRAARAPAASRPAPETAVPAEAPTASPAEPPRDKAAYLAFAREQEAKGRKDVARDLYAQYVASFPDDPGAAEAHYRLGDLAFGERRFRDALGEYGKVAQEFPRSGQAPDALVKSAESMLQLGLRDDAASVLAEVPKRYPATPAAARAKKRLSELGGSAPAGR